MWGGLELEILWPGCWQFTETLIVPFSEVVFLKFHFEEDPVMKMNIANLLH